MIYPTKISANGHIYELDTDYRTALSCFKIIEDNSLRDDTRALGIITLLLGENVELEDYKEALEKCAIYLRCGKKINDKSNEKDMDYFEDETYIRTSIRQCYHINMNEIGYMHWWEYNELIEGLTEETILSRIRQLRTYDTKEIKDLKQKNKIEKAKESVSLKKKNKMAFTDEQIKNMDNFRKLIEGSD